LVADRPGAWFCAPLNDPIPLYRVWWETADRINGSQQTEASPHHKTHTTWCKKFTHSPRQDLHSALILVMNIQVDFQLLHRPVKPSLSPERICSPYSLSRLRVRSCYMYLEDYGLLYWEHYI
jgi:hypothetical protein